MSKEEMESAFPTAEENYEKMWSSPGMTLRDYMAAKAMQSLVSLQEGSHPDAGSQQAYAWADAMLRAREAS